MSRYSTFRTSVVAASAVLAGAAASTNAGFVSFDDVAVTTVVSTLDTHHYHASMGIVFDADAHIVNMVDGSPGFVSTFTNAGGSLANALILSSATGQLSIDITFYMPGTGQAAVTDSFSALFFDTNVGTELGAIEAYGLDGELLASVSALAPAAMYAHLSVYAEGIHRIRLSSDLDGNIVDNLAFAPLYVIPAPGAIALLGLAGLAGRRRRRD